LDEAEAYDDDMLKGFRDTLDSLLVFVSMFLLIFASEYKAECHEAALFSAVVTTFVIKTIEVLEPDFKRITVTLMMEQNRLLRAAGNVTAMSFIPPTSVNLDTASPSTSQL